jgi:hypothetical protein
VSKDRQELPAYETMKKYFGEIERMLYAAEQFCHDNKLPSGACGLGRDCMFHAAFIPNSPYGCRMRGIRSILGDHIEQHDTMPDVEPGNGRNL